MKPAYDNANLLRLLTSIKAGSAQALDHLYDATHRGVYGIAKRVLRDELLAEEVTIDVFAEVWSSAGKYRPERGSVSNWLWLMARSRSLDCLRKRAQRFRHHEDISDSETSIHAATTSTAAALHGPSKQLEASEEAGLLHAALGRLSSEKRDMIVAAFFRGLTHSEIADQMDLPLGTVKTRIRRGLLELRTTLEEEARSA